MYILPFVVEGSGSFPVDMLRYDACTPAHSDDAISMVKHFRDYDYNEVRRVKLMMRSSFAKTQPTAARWESFGWRVVEVGKPSKV